MFNALTIGSMIASLLATPVAATTATPPMDKVGVEIAAVNGSGCPAGTAAVVSSDSTSFKVIYSDFLVQAGPNAVLTESRKNCQISLRVQVPDGFTFAIAKVEYRGFAHLASGVTGQAIGNYYIQGESETTSLSHPLSGPMSSTWKATDTRALGYAPCDPQRNLNINTELRISSPADSKSTSFISMSSTDGSIDTVYHIDWLQCGM